MGDPSVSDDARRRAFLVKADKITSYLLNASHPDGRSKAKFLAGYGLSLESPETLAEALLSHTHPSHLVRELATPWGPRYVFEGPLTAPNGARPRVRTVWQVVETLAEEASLVTVVPL